MKSSRIVSTIAITATLAGCGPEAAPVTSEAPFSSEESEIINGSNLSESLVSALGLVAIYHKKNGEFWRRPCSGLLVQSSPTVNKVVTARHCVTQDAEVDGPEFSPGEVPTSIMLMAAANPGLTVGSQSNPPAGAVPATSIQYATPTVESPFYERDLALITVNANWANRGTSLNVWGWYMGEPTTLANRQIWAYGYGVNQVDPEPTDASVDRCQSDTNPTHTGAGRARRSGNFTVSGGSSSGVFHGYYRHANNGTGGTKVLCGDSGGPDFTSAPPSGLFPVNHITGTHYGADYTNSINTRVGPWLSSALGGMYLSPYSSKLRSLGILGNGVVLHPDSSSQPLRLVYYPGEKRIRANGQCLDFGPATWDPEEDWVILSPCVTPATERQTWFVTGENQIKNGTNGSGGCLTHFTAAGTIGRTPCVSLSAPESQRAPQTWFWHTEM